MIQIQVYLRQKKLTNNSKLQTILVLALMIGIISGLTFASILLRAESRESFDSNGGGSKDSESDKGSKDDNSGDDSKSEDKEQKAETKSDDSGAEKGDNGPSTDSKQDSSEGDKIEAEDYKPPIDREKLKGTPEEQEKAAQEDSLSLPDDQVPPEFPSEKKPVATDDGKSHRTEETENNDPCNYFGRNICEGSKDGKTCNEEKFDCLSDTENGNYCTTGKCPGDDKPYRPPHGKPENINCNNCHGGEGEKHNWCKEHPGKCDHPHHQHKHHNDWCDHHDCHNHHHHSSTHFSDSHSGDVTVKIVTKYEEKNPKNLNDVDLIIGDVYEKFLDLSDKPDMIKVDHLDIDGGDSFAVCLANEDSQEGECTVVEADNDHDTVKVYLTVK